ncbi:unnamed protein product [Caenorhabditis auriculariae]|uniref:BHLH domain-containing protein n=1 Tax=Caenorhabditis auriculariae TaxID=2777116 RepID=A0A8S1H9J6_9PELO|nr:unnamed protein product [Caenorhabditis auriculariae]
MRDEAVKDSSMESSKKEYGKPGTSMFSDVETEDRGGRKKNKPMMEKKRRARINRSLSQLKQILIVDKHVSPGHAKWEKADILEMTVEYVKNLRAKMNQGPATPSPEPPPSPPTPAEEPTSVTSDPTAFMNQMFAMHYEQSFKILPFFHFPVPFQWPPV